MPRREMLIDAYNVMFADPRIGPLVRRDAEAARSEFMGLVVQRQPADGSRVVVVFDAHRDPGPQPTPGRVGRDYAQGVHVVFAAETADAWIQDRVRAHREPASLTVVTSDREILATAQAHGCRILRVSEFLQLRARRTQRAREVRHSEKPQHLSAREVEEWERLFGERTEDE
jgi:predicted RNA-binding protein with PIN domain